MSEPLTAGVAAGSAGVTFAALFPEATPAVMICALAGAALYVLSSGSIDSGSRLFSHSFRLLAVCIALRQRQPSLPVF